MKKHLLLTLVLLLWTFGIAAAQEFVVGDLKYNVTSEENHEVSVAAANNDISGDIVIPATVESDGVEYSVTSITGFSFGWCESITSVTIPESITSFDERAFYGCLQMKEIIVDSNNPNYASYDKSLFNKDKSELICVPCGYESPSYTIIDGVTSVADRAFECCTRLTSITIPESVTSIGSETFNGCWVLTSITIPKSVVLIGYGAFNSCFQMKEIIVDPNNPNYVSYDKSLYDKDMSELIRVPCGCEYSYTIPDGVVSVGGDAFSGCNNLPSVTIPESVTSIGNYAFAGCRSLTSITLPSGVTSIGYFSLSGCNNLSEVYSLNTEAPKAEENTFDEVPSDAVLFVPKSSVDEYATAEGWSKFTNIREIGSVYKFVVNDLKYIVTSDDNLEVSVGANTTEISGDINIPATVEFEGVEYKVTSLSVKAFRECHELTSAIIPEGITEIAEGAFYDCINMTSVTIPEGVTSIEFEAFTYCGSLTSITIPESVVSIGQSAFFSCGGLITITIPESVRTIGEYAFDGCSALSEICSLNPNVPAAYSNSFSYLPENVILYVPEGSAEAYASAEGWSVFTDIREIGVLYEFVVGDLKYNITSRENLEVSVSANTTEISGDITIPATVEYEGVEYKVASLADYAFSRCHELTSVIIPEGITIIAERAFYDCSNMTSVTIPESVTSIGNSALRDCFNLTSITIPESVTSIGGYAFAWCSSLTEVSSLSPSAPEIEDNAFNGIPSDAVLYVPKGSIEAYASTEGWSKFTNIREIGAIYEFVVDGLKYIITSKADSEVSVGADTTEISGDIVIPATVEFEGVEYKVTSLSNRAFRGCGELASVIIPEGITSIADEAFFDCYNMTSVTLPESLTTIGENAFRYCGMPSIVIPANVTSIGEEAFVYCWEMKEIIVDPNNTQYASYNQSLYNKEMTVLIQVPSGYEDSSYIIPDGVTVIGKGAMSACGQLKDITIPESVTAIDSDAFSNCGNLISITIPAGVTSIGNDAFAWCGNLSTVYSLNPSVPETQYNPFAGLPSDAVLYVPERSVDAYAAAEGWSVFSEIREIGGIYEFVVDNLKYTFTSKEAREVSVSANTTEISGDIVIPATVEFEGAEYNVTSLRNRAFRGCTELTSVSIPEGITSIANEAFNDCYNMTSVTIPESVTTIGDYAFAWCYNLSTVYSLNANAPEAQNNPFPGIPSEAVLYVPEGSVDAYAAAEGWSVFSEIREIGGLYEFVVDDLRYTITSKEEFEVSVAANTTEISGNIVIPATVEFEGVEYKVTSIRNRAFSDCYEITSAIISEGITSIAEWAFYDCYKMISVTLPESVTTIGENAFRYCSMTSINIPANVISIGEEAFAHCYRMKEITVDPNNTRYASYNKSLYNKEMSELIKVPCGYEDSSYIIPEGVTLIGIDAFNVCGNLKEITIPESVTAIESWAFANCGSLTSITIPAGVTSIGSCAFAWCGNLSEVTSLNPEALEIEDNTFTDIPSDAFLFVPKGSVDAYASATGWSVFTNIREIGTVYKFVIDNLKYTITSEEGSEVSVGANTTEISGDLVIPTTVEFEGVEYKVTSLRNKAFHDCERLTSVTMPEGFTSIAEDAFSNCYNLVSVTIPEGVTSIINAAFYQCNSLKSITIPESVTTIRDYAFAWCFDLSTVYSLNSNAPEVQDNTFAGLSSEAILYVPKGCVEAYASAEGWSEFSNIREIGDVYEFVVDGLKYIITSKADSEVSVGADTTEISGDIVIPATVEFEEVEYKVTSLRNNAFYGCTELTSVTIPEGITTIAEDVFRGCYNLISVTLPESITSIGSTAFISCRSLKTITIPASVTTIEEYAFAWCYSLSTVYSLNPEAPALGEEPFAGLSSDAILYVPQGCVEAYAAAEGWSAFSEIREIGAEEVVYSLTFNVVSGETAIEGAMVTVMDEVYFTDENGRVEISEIDVPEGSLLKYSVYKDGYEPFKGEADFAESSAVVVNVELEAAEATLDIKVMAGDDPVEGAYITFDGNAYTTDEYGSVKITGIYGPAVIGTSVPVTVYKDGYVPFEGEADFSETIEAYLVVNLEADAASFTLKVFADNEPVEGALVTFLDKEYISDETGEVKVTGLEATALVGTTVAYTVYKDGYEPFEGEADFTETMDAWSIAELKAAEATVTVKVMDGEDPVQGAMVTFEGYEYLTDANGEVVITGINGPSVIGRTVALTVTKDGYEPFEGEADFTETLDAYVVATLVNIQTAIRDIINDIENGDLKAYDLNGRRVMRPQNGQFYIINGQKLLINL